MSDISSFSKLLGQAIAKLPWGVQLGIVLVIFLGAVLTIGSIAFSMRRGRRRRAHPRVPLSRPIQVSWKYNPDLEQHSQGRCLDVSEGGLMMELPDPIVVSERIRFRVDDVHLAGTASVRYCNHVGRSYLIGVKFRHLSA
jgi:PilZ domain-containing protein